MNHATHQATMVAQSILDAGGTEGAALTTAEAAAMATLCPKSRDIPKGMQVLGRRKAKQHAEVIASLALMSALNRSNQGPQTLSRLESPVFPPHSVEVTPDVESESPISAVEKSQLGDTSVVSPKEALNTMISAAPVAVPIKEKPFEGISQDACISEPKRYERSVSSKEVESKPGRRGKALINYFARKTVTDSQRKKMEKDARKKRKVIKEKKSEDKIPATTRSVAKDDAAVPLTDQIFEKKADSKGSFESQDRSYNSNYSEEDNEDSLMQSEGTRGGSNDSESVETANNSSPADGFMKKNVDPFLASLTSVFICGPSAAASQTVIEGAVAGENDDRDDMEDIAEGSDREFGVPRDTKRHVLAESLSTVDSEELLRTLNTNSSSDTLDYNEATENRETVEDIVLLSLAGSAVSTRVTVTKGSGDTTSQSRLTEVRETAQQHLDDAMAPPEDTIAKYMFKTDSELIPKSSEKKSFLGNWMRRGKAKVT
jgi:hypothetical protein